MARSSFTTKTAGLLCLLFATSHAQAREPQRPWETPEISIETGVLWQMGVSTPLSYRLVPTQVSWRSPRVFGRELSGGRHLLVRSRVGLLAT